jgi:hypothetical protein
MINLLPPALKADYRYARRNVTLRKWVVVFLIALVGLGAVATYGLLTMRQTNLDYQHQVTALETQLKREKLDQTKKQVQEVSSSLKLAVTVLSNEVLFSKLIQQIGAVMPRGAVLTGLTINQVSGGIDLTAGATSYNSATQVQVNLADPANKLFSKVDINSINCGKSTAATANYACSVQLRALFNTNNPFLFINQGKAS